MSQSESSQAILHYDRGAAFGRQGAYGIAITEFEEALKYSPPPDLELVICYNLAVSIQKHHHVSPADIPTFEIDEDQAKQTTRIIELCDRVISIYNRKFETGQIITDLPVKHFYQQAETLKLRTQALQPKKKGGCFIATTVYGSDQAPQVRALRVFRDTHLLRSRLGRCAVGCYYRIAPQIALVVSTSPTIIRYLRICLDIVVYTLSRSTRPNNSLDASGGSASRN
jgi:hypothetical protein